MDIRAIHPPHRGPRSGLTTVAMMTADMDVGILHEHCGGFGRGSAAVLLMLAVRTKPSSVLAERKLLMRLDGVCRHYLAMTKSAHFLFADGGKFNRGPYEKHLSLKQRPQTPGPFSYLLFALLLFGGGYSRIRDVKVAPTVARSGSLFCPTDSFSRCCSDRKCPN